MGFEVKNDNTRKILIYSQDPGGANFLAPAIARLYQEIKSTEDALVVAHPLSEEIFSNYKIPYSKLADEVIDGTVSIFEWECYLKKKISGQLLVVLVLPIKI